MNLGSLKKVLGALEGSGVRYLVVGGLATVAHGFVRMTQDLDLVLDPENSAIVAALEALAGLGYQPLAPVPLMAFADVEQRESWRREKGAVVFQLFSDLHPHVRIDLFLEAPFDFDQAWAGALRLPLAPGLIVPFVGFDLLLEMKRAAGRPEDLYDIEHLERLRFLRSTSEDEV